MKNGHNTQPNYAARRVAGVIGLSAVTAVAGLGVNSFKNAHEQDVLLSKLSAPTEQVMKDLREGDIDKSKVVFVSSDALSTKAYNQAAELTEEKTDTPVLAAVISAQQENSPVQQGEVAILPTSMVNAQAVEAMNSAAELQRVLPDDPNTHVG
jgi:hypothetical protein